MSLTLSPPLTKLPRIVCFFSHCSYFSFGIVHNIWVQLEDKRSASCWTVSQIQLRPSSIGRVSLVLLTTVMHMLRAVTELTESLAIPQAFHPHQGRLRGRLCVCLECVPSVGFF